MVEELTGREVGRGQNINGSLFFVFVFETASHIAQASL